jgi:microcystin degradation protein MlrC
MDVHGQVHQLLVQAAQIAAATRYLPHMTERAVRS